MPLKVAKVARRRRARETGDSESRGAVVTSDAGLLLPLELDEHLVSAGCL